MITTYISYNRGPPEIIVYMAKIRAGFAVIDGITQFGCNLSGSACYNSYGGDMGGGGVHMGGGGRIFGKGGFVKRGVLENPLNPPGYGPGIGRFLLHYRARITVSGVYYIFGWYNTLQ